MSDVEFERLLSLLVKLSSLEGLYCPLLSKAEALLRQLPKFRRDVVHG